MIAPSTCKHLPTYPIVSCHIVPHRVAIFSLDCLELTKSVRDAGKIPIGSNAKSPICGKPYQRPRWRCSTRLLWTCERRFSGRVPIRTSRWLCGYGSAGKQYIYIGLIFNIMQNNS